MTYKKYILFQFEDYYPGGGMSDIRESFDTVKEAEDFVAAQKWKPDNSELVDRDTWQEVKTSF